MIVEKKEMTEQDTQALVKDKLLDLNALKQTKPISDFFQDFRQLQKQVAEKNESIKELEQTIQYLRQSQRNDDDYTRLRNQMFRSEMRCVQLRSKLDELYSTIAILKEKEYNLRIENEALNQKCESLLGSCQIIESKYKRIIQNDDILRPSPELPSRNRDQQSNFSTFIDTPLPPLSNSKSAVVKINGSGQAKKPGHSSMIVYSETEKTKQKYTEEQARALERSNTLPISMINSTPGESGITIKRQKNTSNCKYSDKILKEVNLCLIKSFKKIIDCGIYQVDTSYDNTCIALNSAKGSIKILDQNYRDTGSFFGGKDDRNHCECIRYSLRTGMLASGETGKTISLYKKNSQNNYKFFSQMVGFNDSVGSVDFFNQDRQIVGGSQDQTFRIFDIETSTQIQCKNTGSKINSLQSSFNNDQIVSGHTDGSVRIYRQNQLASNLQLDYSIAHVQLSSDENSILTSGSYSGQELSVIDVRTMKVIHKLSTSAYMNSSRMNKPTFAFGDRYVIAGSFDGQMYIWSLNNSNDPPAVITGQANSQIHCTYYSQNQKMLFVTDSIGNMFVYQQAAESG